jgi:hypothetical protein
MHSEFRDKRIEIGMNIYCFIYFLTEELLYIF